uniref:Uncharacterized protein n=1 Tax=Manihot esculenta TaxID=3983 RepID=A0A251JEA1_MANES
MSYDLDFPQSNHRTVSSQPTELSSLGSLKIQRHPRETS